MIQLFSNIYSESFYKSLDLSGVVKYLPKIMEKFLKSKFKNVRKVNVNEWKTKFTFNKDKINIEIVLSQSIADFKDYHKLVVEISGVRINGRSVPNRAGILDVNSRKDIFNISEKYIIEEIEKFLHTIAD